MQAQVKYESEVKTAVLGDRTITVRNLTPVLSPQEQDSRTGHWRWGSFSFAVVLPTFEDP